MIRASKKTLARRRAFKVLDAEARQMVFERDDFKCVRCRNERGIQWCHIFSRRHTKLRWDPENALTLCAGCHLFWHHEPIMATDWFRKNFKERYEYLLEVFNRGGKVNIKELLEKRK